MNQDKDNGRFVSDCIDVFIDEPGDHTVRPIPPGPQLEQAKALRELIQEAEEAKKRAQEAQKP